MVLATTKKNIYNRDNKFRMIGENIVTAAEVIKQILKDKDISQVELAEKTNTTRQNLGNKFNRDNFSSLELVEIADTLGMELLFKNKNDGKEYVIDYPNETKFQPKRKTTKKE